jgi:uncharacterized protein (TIGR02453 family)
MNAILEKTLTLVALDRARIGAFLGWAALDGVLGKAPMAKFQGFHDANARFFRGLAKNNDREWFLAHKDEYEEGWNAPMKLLLDDVHAAIDPLYAYCDLDAPKVFRIYRDVRFSKDKAPYKTHVGGFIPVRRAGTRVTDVPMALYFQVGTEVFGAAGHYIMEPSSLARFRASVVDEARGKELGKILASLGRKGLVAQSHDALKRVPKGFDPEHPRADLLRRKGLHVPFAALPKGLLTSPKLVPWLRDQCKTVAPLVEWLVRATV